MGDALMKDKDDMDKLLAIYYHTWSMALNAQQQQVPTTQPSINGPLLQTKKLTNSILAQLSPCLHLLQPSWPQLSFGCRVPLNDLSFPRLVPNSNGRFYGVRESLLCPNSNQNHQLSASIEAELLMPPKC
jgi:hypothetical protein